MILNLLVFVLIVLVTLYLSTQGMLSSLLALATSIFSSILAMALFEPLQGIIAGWRPDYARGVTFLLLFFLIFCLTRIAGDMAVPKNIKLTIWQNRIAGGLIGFFVALVVIGTLVIGVEMLPVGRAPLGFERFPEGGYLQKLDDSGKPIPGEIAKARNIWFAPDRFVLAIWNGASGRSLGGGRPFASVHPDLSIESYGYRSQVENSQRTLPADLMKVTAAWKDKSYTITYKDDQKKQHTETHEAHEGNVFVMVRTEISKGDSQPPHIACDTDNNLRIAASQVRLLASSDNKSNQFYPIGYLEKGQVFTPLALDSGYVQDDFNKDNLTTDDWIFEVPADLTPRTIEIKQLARQPIDFKNREDVALATNYPTKGYMKEISHYEVKFTPKATHTIKKAYVLVLREGIKIKDISKTEITNATKYVNDTDLSMEKRENGWQDNGGPGVPSHGDMQSVSKVDSQRFSNAPDDSPVEWGVLVRLLLLGQCQNNGQANVANIPAGFDSNGFLMNYISKGSNIISAVGKRDDNDPGLMVVPKISRGTHPVIIAAVVANKDGVDRGIYVWVKTIEFGKETGKDSTGKPILDTNISDTLSESDSGVIFYLDLDDQVKP